MLEVAPWLCGYWPVISEAREGQHCGVEAM